MKKLLGLAAIGFLLFLAYDYGRPVLERYVGPIGGGGSEFDQCLRHTEFALEEFESKLARFGGQDQPLSRLGTTLKTTRGRLREASSRCLCDGEACAKVSEAVEELDRAVETAENQVLRGDHPDTPTNALRRIRASLERAQQIDERGY